MATRARRGNQNVLNQIHIDQQTAQGKGLKRQTAGDRSPQEKVPAKKTRTAFGDITNRENVKLDQNKKKGGQKKSNKPALKPSKKSSTKSKSQVIAIPRPSSKADLPLTSSQQSTDMSWDILELSNSSSSQGSNSSQASSTASSPQSEVGISVLNERNTQLSQQSQSTRPAWIDIDAENMNDPYQCSLYAYHIFEYYKTREAKFVLPDYLQWQDDLSANMRAILADWLVEVQENFELNHETLYLAVKLVDHYLATVKVRKDRLQLVGATAMFIASKFDERLPPVLDDFLYICDDAYNRDELLTMERAVLRAVDFDLGIPLSYRYLRRYAKCGRVCMETLTLGRYILELSLMDYHFSRMSDAKLAAATLLLSMKMKKTGTWDATLEHYTGCKVEDLTETVKLLNQMVATTGHKNLTTIRTKYSHKVFHEVAKVAALPADSL